MLDALRLGAMFWAGLLAGVSFLATPVKFRADSLSLPVALDVGRETFHLMSRIEIVFALMLATLATLAAGRNGISATVAVAAALVVVIVAAQVAVVLPELDVRTVGIINGGDPGESRLHLVYIGLELTKFVALIAIALRLSFR